ncbi:MAG: hypothetical protein IKC11_03685 [Clostridia bacterium]|nr:hypothetical protein [Clostridia bacterium]
MFATTKKKRIFLLSMLITLIAIVFVGVGLGVFFLVRDNNSMTLAKRQAVFGRTVNSAVVVPEQAEIDLSNLPSGVEAKNVVMASDRYFVIKTNSSIYVVYDKETSSYVDIGSKVNFNKVDAIYGSLVVLSYGSHITLFNLTSLEVVANLLNVNIIYDSGFLLLTSNNKNPITVYQDSVALVDTYVALLNVESGEVVFEAKGSDDIINVTMSYGMLVASYPSRTEVYKLSNSLVLKKSFENKNEIQEGTNVTSLITNKAYYMSSYYRVFAIHNNLVLIEKSYVVSSAEYDITGLLSNGEHRNYKNSYYVWDLSKNVQFDIDNNGMILEALDVDISRNYFALVRVPINQKTALDSENKLITYYQIVKTKKGYKLVQLVEYDYSKFGQVIGYNGKGLFTTGTSNSAYIGFDGEKEDFKALEVENSKITQSTYNDVVVVSSVQGEKKLYDNKGNLLVGKLFTQISPFVDGGAVALYGDQYYLVSNSGLTRMINGFAEEFSQYVFMGIGYFFVGEEGAYKVCDHTGEIVYDDVNVSLEYNLNAHKVIMVVQSDSVSKVIEITPTEDVFSSKNLIEYFNTFQQERNFAPAKTADASESIRIDRTVNYLTKTEDQNVGGVAQISYNIGFSNLDALTFKPYASLNTKEASMIPGFNQGATGQYTYKVDAPNAGDGKEHTYVFEGAYFVGDEDSYYSLALMRLNENGTFYYMVTLAVRDSYLSKVQAETANKSGATTNMLFYDYRVGVIREVDVLSGNDTLALSYAEMKTKLVATMWQEGGLPNQTPYKPSGQDNITITPRQVDLEYAGFDGGLIFTSTEASAMSIQFTIRNTYEATNQKSKVVGNGETKDCGRYTLSYSGSTLSVNVKPGYFLTYFDINVGNATDALYTNLTSGSLIGSSVNIISSATFTVPYASYIQLTGVTIVESFSHLNLIRYNKDIREKLDASGNVVMDEEDEEPILEVYELEEYEELGMLYFYYGYGSDVRTERNPAQIGFLDFKKRTSVEIPEKDGYTFKSYTLVNIEEKNVRTQVVEIINKEGNLTIIPGTDAVAGEEKYYADNYLLPTSGLSAYFLEAIYEAKTYTINYYMDKHNYDLGRNELWDSNDNLTRKQILTEIKYFDYITELHDITTDDYNLDNNPVPMAESCIYRGFDFQGWFYWDAENEEEVELEIGDIYTTVGNLRVYAKWEAQVYTLEFDANVGENGAYQDITVGGYPYNIDSAYFTKDFDYYNDEDPTLNVNITAGSEFDQDQPIVKQITYAGMYGSLPALEGRSVQPNSGIEEYVFLGWYLHKDLNAVNDSYESLITGEDTNGNPIVNLTSGSLVNIIPPIVDAETEERKLTIYAHYRRIVYSYTLTSTVDSMALGDDNKELPFALKYTVEGSTAKGVKALYSTDSKYESYNKGSSYEGQDCNKWSLQDAIDPTYTFYMVQGEQVKINAFVGEGYYVSAVVFKLPDYRGGQYEAVMRGLWEAETQDQFEFAEELEGEIGSGVGNIECYSSGFNIQVMMEEFYASIANHTDVNPLCIDVEIQFSSMKFTNEFNVSGVYKGEVKEGQEPPVVAGDGRVTNENGEIITKQENIIYGYTNTYKTMSGASSTSSNVANSYLKSVTLDDVTLITFEYEYGYESVPSIISTTPVFYHIMSANVSPKSSEWKKEGDGTTYKTDTYELAFETETGTLIFTLKSIYYYVKADTSLNYYVYELKIKSKKDHLVDVCYEDVRSIVEFKLYDVDYSTEDNGLIPNEDTASIQKRATITVAEGTNNYNGYYTQGEDTISPTQYIRYNILPTENYFISSISISYNGSERYIIAFPTIAINNDGGSINISQTAGFEIYGASSPLLRNENTVLFKSTNISVSWLSGRGFAVTINQIRHKVAISLTMLEYKLFQVQTPGSNDTTFEINQELASAKGNNFPTNVAIPAGVYYYKETGVVGTSQETITYCNWVIAGKQDGLDTITVKPDISGKIAYKVRSVIPSGMNDVIRVDEDGFAQYDTTNTSQNGHKAAVELAVDTAGFLVNSYLGRGTKKLDSIIDSGIVPKNDTEVGHIYTLDSNAFVFGGKQGPFSTIMATYCDPTTAEYANKQYDNAYINVSFTGGTITLSVHEIEGYMLSSIIVELYIVEAGTGGVGEATKIYTILPDAVEVSSSGSRVNITITIPKLKNSQYELRIFQKPIEYEVVYDSANSAGDTNPATGTVEKTKHLYNVPSTVRTDATYIKEGYTAIGYSKEKKTGSDLTEADCYFLLPGFVDDADKNKSSAINENLWTGTEATANKTVILYAVYKANEYNIIYNTNDNTMGNGSSPAETTTEISKTVVFDKQFGALNVIKRFGYTFNGWFTAKEGGIKVQEGNTLDIELFNKIKNPEDDKSVILYAQYTAKSYTISIILNDRANGNGSSDAVCESGSLSQTLTFDDDSKKFVYPTITRVGYDYKGLRSEMTNAIDAKALTSADYLSATDFNWQFMVSSGFDNDQINQIDNAQSMMVYCTYTPKAFKMYVNLNNTKMANYGDEVTVVYDGRSYVEKDHYVDGLEITIEFDALLGTLPTITMQGYSLIGFYQSKSYDKENIGVGALNETTPLDFELFEVLTYTNSSNVDTALKSLYESGKYTFSIYAQYGIKEMEISTTGSTASIVKLVNGVGSYSVTNGASFGSGSNSVIGEYGCDAIVDILPATGYFVSSLTISYVGETGAGVITVIFTFDNQKEQVSYVASGGVSSGIGSFGKLNGDYATVAEGMYLMHTGYSQYTNSLKTFRVVLGFEYVMESISVEVTETPLLFTATFMVPNTSGWEQYTQKLVPYGSKNFDSDITNPSLVGKSFMYWSTDKSGNGVLDSSVTIVTNTSYYAHFVDESASASVSFWIWNPEAGYYELIETVNGSGEFSGAMPSPSTDAWPGGSSYYFSGWQVLGYKPSSPIYRERGNFDGEYQVYGELNVYACYHNKGFTEPSYSTSVKAVTGNATSNGSPSISSNKNFTLSDVGKTVKDYYYYKKKVTFRVTIKTVDLYKYEYNRTGEYSPVRFYDYVTYVAEIPSSSSGNISSALSSRQRTVSSPSGSQDIDIDSYTYSYTVTYTYKVVKKTRTVKKQEAIKDEEGNVTGYKDVYVKEDYATTSYQGSSSTESTRKKEAYNALTTKTHYFVAYLSPREKGVNHESFKYLSRFPVFFTLKFPSP